MTSTVDPFTRLHRERRLPCPCKPGRVCATHQCMDLAAWVRDVRQANLEELLVPAEQHRDALDRVLAVLDAVTGSRPTVPSTGQGEAR